MNQAGDTAMTVDTARTLALEPAPLKARPKGPAKPILKGVGLDAPFFSDKNRAFWVLQSIGWGGYFILRSLSGLANSMGAMFVVHALLLTATGYSLTLLMATLFRRLIAMRAMLGSLRMICVEPGIHATPGVRDLARSLHPRQRAGAAAGVSRACAVD